MARVKICSPIAHDKTFFKFFVSIIVEEYWYLKYRDNLKCSPCIHIFSNQAYFFSRIDCKHWTFPWRLRVADVMKNNQMFSSGKLKINKCIFTTGSYWNFFLFFFIFFYCFMNNNMTFFLIVWLSKYQFYNKFIIG